MEEYITSILKDSKYKYIPLTASQHIEIIFNLYKNDIFSDISESHDAIVYNYAAIYYSINKDYTRAVELYKIAIDKHDSSAIHNLANLYRSGHYINKENATLMSNLADRYVNGTGIDQDVKRALELYHMAADNGNSYSMNTLGLIYAFDPEIAAQDYDLSIKFFHMAVMNGNLDELEHILNLSIVNKKNYFLIRKNLYKYYEQTGDIKPLEKICKDSYAYIKKKEKIRQLKERIRVLEENVEKLMCAPPHGPIYQAAFIDFKELSSKT